MKQSPEISSHLEHVLTQLETLTIFDPDNKIQTEEHPQTATDKK